MFPKTHLVYVPLKKNPSLSLDLILFWKNKQWRSITKIICLNLKKEEEKQEKETACWSAAEKRKRLRSQKNEHCHGTYENWLGILQSFDFMSKHICHSGCGQAVKYMVFVMHLKPKPKYILHREHCRTGARGWSWQAAIWIQKMRRINKHSKRKYISEWNIHSWCRR